MKRTIRLVNLTHLNDNYNHGNVVYASYGIAPCLTEAMGSGGGHIPLIPIIERVE